MKYLLREPEKDDMRLVLFRQRKSVWFTSMSDQNFSKSENIISAMAVNILGVVSLVIFYLIILGIGLWAARRTRQVGGGIHTRHDVNEQ